MRKRRSCVARPMSANLLRKKKAATGTRIGVQPLLPLAPTDCVAGVPDAARRQSMDLLAELLKAVANAENNSMEVIEHEHR